MKSEWIYGNHRNLGWGGAEIQVDPDTYSTLDFNPEFECKSDVRRYWSNRKHILALKNMTIWKYTKILVKGIVVYRKLMEY